MVKVAAGILNKSAIPEDQITGTRFLEAIIPLEESLAEMENDFEEEPPDELCDPIMGTLMENPVKLPTSGQIVDRTTTARQLVSAPMDPFNRQSLTLDQVIPLPDIKAQVVAWKAGQKKRIERNELKVE